MKEILVMRKRGITSGCAVSLLCLILAGCYSGSPIRLELERPSPTFPYNGMKLVPDTLTLTWSSSAWATSYVVQVSTDFGFSAIIDSAICLSPLLVISSPLLNNATYFWRVSSSDGQRMSEWSGVYSFTTGVAPPELYSPEDNAIWVPETLTLAWSRAAGDLRYYLQLSADSGFSSFTVNDSADSAFFAVTAPLVQSTSYYWRVSVADNQGLSGWSEAHVFTTVDSLPAPVLVYPGDGASGVSGTDTLEWDDIPSQWASYCVQVSTVADFSAGMVIDTTLPPSSTHLPLNGLSGGTAYYWRVAARIVLEDFMDRQGVWSATWSFTAQ